MFNPIFKQNVQGRKHPGSYAFAEPELLVNKAYSVVQKVINDNKIPMIVTTIMMKIMMK